MSKLLKVIIAAILILLLIFIILIAKEVSLQEPILLGDVNMDGIIDHKDMDMVHQYLLRMSELDTQQKIRADINQDGEITVLDLLRIHKYIGGG